MSLKVNVAKLLHLLRRSLVTLVIIQISLGGTLTASLQAQQMAVSTVTPIKRVIVLIGENRTFDHLFATYVPKGGQSVRNLLSNGMIPSHPTPAVATLATIYRTQFLSTSIPTCH